MMLSMSSDSKFTSVSPVTEYECSNQDEWYSDASDEVFVLDFDPLDDPHKLTLSDSHLLEVTDDFGDETLVPSSLNSLCDGGFFDVSKDLNGRLGSPNAFSFEKTFLGTGFAMSSAVGSHDSANVESFKRQLSPKPPSGSTNETSKSNSIKGDPLVKRAKVENWVKKTTKRLYGEVDDQTSDLDFNGSSGDGSKSQRAGVPKQKRTSKFRGVSCCGKDRKWQARIRESNRVRYLGRFQTEVEAALVYDEASRKCKGEGAPTNFVRMDTETMHKLQEAYEKHGYVPASMQHLMANPRKTKPKKSSDKRSYNKKTTSNSGGSASPAACKLETRLSPLSEQVISPSSNKLNPIMRFDHDHVMSARTIFEHIQKEKSNCISTK